MYCPDCKTEYREGFAECADCHIPLVDNLPQDQDEPEPNLKFVKILETNDLTDIVQIESALGAAGIRYFIQGGIINSITPFYQPAVLMVAEEDAEEAVELLKDVELNYYRFVFGKPDTTTPRNPERKALALERVTYQGPIDRFIRIKHPHQPRFHEDIP